MEGPRLPHSTPQEDLVPKTETPEDEPGHQKEPQNEPGLLASGFKKSDTSLAKSGSRDIKPSCPFGFGFMRMQSLLFMHTLDHQSAGPSEGNEALPGQAPRLAA